MSDAYRSIQTRVRAEPEKVKGSRHIATAIPFGVEADLTDLITELRAEFPSACHHAWAWRRGIGDRAEFYYSDDGEPSGSAGRPILQHIEGRDVTQIAVVVTRIFGGTKLGVGGLVRAYGGAVAAVLDEADILEMVPKLRLQLQFDYALSSAVQRVLHGKSIEVLSSDYGAAVAMSIEVIAAEADTLTAELTDGTAGAVSIRQTDG